METMKRTAELDRLSFTILAIEASAKKLGITQTTYINWEKEPKKISIENAFRISTILDVEVNDIIFLPDDSKKIG